MQEYLKINNEKVVGSCHTGEGWDTVFNVQVIHFGLGNMMESLGTDFRDGSTFHACHSWLSYPHLYY